MSERLVVVVVLIFSEVFLSAESQERSSCPGSLVDKIAAGQIMATGCGPHTHHGKSAQINSPV